MKKRKHIYLNVLQKKDDKFVLSKSNQSQIKKYISVWKIEQKIIECRTSNYINQKYIILETVIIIKDNNFEFTKSIIKSKNIYFSWNNFELTKSNYKNQKYI